MLTRLLKVNSGCMHLQSLLDNQIASKTYAHAFGEACETIIQDNGASAEQIAIGQIDRPK
jgi:hypothetical protein